MALTPEQVKERVNYLLKAADAKLKESLYDEALDLVRAIYRIDPLNMYARATEEHILMIKADKEAQKKFSENYRSKSCRVSA
jgi:two-component SAPR family response regulator